MAISVPTLYAGVDLAEARQLADLINYAVAELEQQSVLEKNSDDDIISKKASMPISAIVSAAGQLKASVRPPNVVIADIAGSVSLLGKL
jgi:hypothetical protein